MRGKLSNEQEGRGGIHFTDTLLHDVENGVKVLGKEVNWIVYSVMVYREGKLSSLGEVEQFGGS